MSIYYGSLLKILIGLFIALADNLLTFGYCKVKNTMVVAA